MTLTLFPPPTCCTAIVAERKRNRGILSKLVLLVWIDAAIGFLPDHLRSMFHGHGLITRLCPEDGPTECVRRRQAGSVPGHCYRSNPGKLPNGNFQFRQFESTRFWAAKGRMSDSGPKAIVFSAHVCSVCRRVLVA